jgi:hypothetical protein
VTPDHDRRGVVLGPAAGTRYIEHARQLYLCGHKLETTQALAALPV